MNAAIKLNHHQYLQVLEQLLTAKVNLPEGKINTVKLPLFNLIALLVTIYTQYTEQHQLQPLTLFVLHYFQVKYPSPFEMYRHMQGMIKMWKKYLEAQPEARLFLSLLQPERADPDMVKLFLKIRKTVLRSLGPKLMQDVILTHQDMITLSHTIFTTQMKAYTSKKIHELFLTLNKKTLYANRINGAVACQFFLNCSEKFERQCLRNIQNQELIDRKESEPFFYQKAEKPINYQPFLLQNQETQEPVKDDPCDLSKNTGKFRESPPKKHRDPGFLVNNLSAVRESKESLSPGKGILHPKYSYSWQKFLKTNQQIKQKLLKPYQ